MGYKSVFIWSLACSGTLANEVEGECKGKLLPTLLAATKFNLGLSINTVCLRCRKGTLLKAPLTFMFTLITILK